MANRSVDSLSDIPPEVPLSYLLENPLVHQLQPEISGVTASAAPKRARGRPPKSKPEVQQNGQFLSSVTNGSVSEMAEESQAVKRSRGRPRKDGAPSSAVKRGGRPPGRPRKSKPVSALETVVSPIVVNGSRKRGRPKKNDSGAAAVQTPIEIGEAMAVAPAKRRGRPPKVDGVFSVSRTGAPRGRPRKDATPAAAEAPRQEVANYGALKRKYEFLQDRVKEATNKLKAAISAMEEVQVIAAALNTNRAVAAVDGSSR